MSRQTLYIDLETFSECDLGTRGAWVYAADPSTEVLLVGWAVGDGPAGVWDRTDEEPFPPALKYALDDPETEVVAHNSAFDRWVLGMSLGFVVPRKRWRDTMVKAYTMGLPGSLEVVGGALGLSEDLQKIKDGNRLVQRFCMPQPKSHKVRRRDRSTDPEDWTRFVEYAARDVESMREIDRLLPDWNYRGDELALWHLDQRVNDRGLPVDVRLAKRMMEVSDEEIERLNTELQAVTDGAVDAHSKRDKMIAWVRSRGVHIEGYTKADISGLLETDDLPPDVRRALEIRREAGRTSTSKYLRFGQMAHKGRVHGAFQFAGAQRTGRWAGRGIQPQNFPRPSIEDTDAAAEAVMNGTASLMYDSLMEVTASCVRSVIAAPAGHKLVVGDYANIEGRMLAFLAGEDWKLQAFREFDLGVGPDVYKASYSKAFGTPLEDVDKPMRFIGKVMELACGYQGSKGAFNAMAALYGASLPEDQALQAVSAWRDAHPRVVAFWYALEEAARAALRNPGKAYRAGRVSFKKVRRWLLCRLPSGRFVPYFGAHEADNSLRYQGVYLGRWTTLDTYGGKLAENATQAASRDVMAYNMPLVEDAGYLIDGTVHDEIISETPDTDAYNASGLARAMGHTPPWAEGLPVAVEAYEATRYRKD